MELEVKIEKELRNFTLRADFSLRDEVFALLGASGCGKSMTLKCIAGLERPDRGRIVLDGEVLFDSEQGIDLPPQKRRVGYLFQNFALFPNMTIADNIRFVARGTRQQREERVRENLARFALSELGNAYPMELSGGQQQRAALARILASDAKILLLDEPFSALDHYLKWKLELELREVLRAYDGAALLVSHDRGEVYRMASRAAVIDRGQMQAALQQGSLHGVVAGGGLLALGGGAHAGANVQPGVPAAAHKGGGLFGQGFVARFGQQDQHVDIRMRIQLAPAQPPYGDQRHGVPVQLVCLPQLQQQPFGQACQLPQRRGCTAARRRGVQQRLFILLVAQAQGGKGGRGVHIRRRVVGEL